MSNSRRCSRSGAPDQRRLAAVGLVTATALTWPTFAHAAPASAAGSASVLDTSTSSVTDVLSKGCPALVALGVDGLGIATGTGASAAALGDLAQQAVKIGVPVVTALVPVALTAATSGGDYAQVVAAGQTALTTVAQQVLQQCPAAQLAFTANGQGAQMLSTFLQGVGAGDSPIPADKVSAAALFGAPDRAAGSGMFPGTTQSTPSGDGEVVDALPKLDAATPRGGGVAASFSDQIPDFGALAGKVASICQTGDLTCDIDPASGTAQAITDVAGSGGDPVAALQQITGSLLSNGPTEPSQQGGTGGGLLTTIVNALMGSNVDLGAFTASARTGYTEPTTSTSKTTPTTTTTGTSTTSEPSGSGSCPVAERIDANKAQPAEIIAEVDRLDKDCPNTKTTVVGHSYGAQRAGDVAEHYGKDYAGHTRFVLNADPGTGRRTNLPPNTVINCNHGDPVCDKSDGNVTNYFATHMPDKYPASYDNNPPGLNMTTAGSSGPSTDETRPTVTTTTGTSTSTNGHNWDAVAQCEAGGDWTKNTGNGYYGGLQFTPSTWTANGGKGLPSDASRDEQIRVAENVLKTQGPSAWPTCGKQLGTTSTVDASDQTNSEAGYVGDWFTAVAQDTASN